MKPKVYIAGRVGDRDIKSVRLQFNYAAIKLKRAGYKPINPLDIGTSESLSWEENMKICIAELMRCDYIFLLPGWTESKGANLENAIALNLKIPRIDLPC